MPDKVLIDTTVFIHYFRGQPEAAKFLDDISSNLKVHCIISRITESELFYGCNSKEQEEQTIETLNRFDIIQLSRDIMILAGQIRRGWAGTNKPNMADVLIASTAIKQKAILYTHNVDDFKTIANLDYRKPYNT